MPVAKQNSETYSDILTAFGAMSITFTENETQPIYQSGCEQAELWDEMTLIALFSADLDLEQLLLQLATVVDEEVLRQVRWEKVDPDWDERWKENLRPMQFGERLWVCPSWCEVPDLTAINIILDPEMAFGTGSHQTTALCLEWLANNPPLQQTVIDFGCGSGILAIAAAKLGADCTYAIDIDPIALEVCSNNAKKNGVPAAALQIALVDALPTVTADVLIANILASPLLELASTFAMLTKPGATLVLSGILETQADMIIQAYQLWYQDFQVTKRDEWLRITAIRSD